MIEGYIYGFTENLHAKLKTMSSDEILRIVDLPNVVENVDLRATSIYNSVIEGCEKELESRTRDSLRKTLSIQYSGVER